MQANYEEWEILHFEHIINLRDIFASYVLDLHPEMNEYIFSEKFLFNFGKMIYNSSSKKIPLFPKNFSDEIETEYLFYQLKKS